MEGRNIAFELRFGDGAIDRLPGDQRAVRAVWGGEPGQVGGRWPALDRAARPELRTLGLGEPFAATLFRESEIDGHLVTLGGVENLGRWVRPKDEDATRRQVAARVAGKLKVLADPTRLGILLWLARQPASVTEVAGHFNLSQPTISAHVQLLREAGLLEEKQLGRSAILTAHEQGLRSLFDGAEESLLKLFLEPSAAGRD